MKSEDYLELPKCTVQDYIVRLSPEEKALYEKFERDRILEIEDVEDITAVNAAVLTNKLLQFANGAIYDEDRKWHEMHTAKIEALEEIIESANGQPVMVAYAFKHDLERIKKALKSYSPRTLDKPQDISDWNEGKIKVLLTHPASAGHGLNLQFGGHIVVWFGNTWSLELYMQLNKRLDRPGQKMPVLILRMIVEGTMDEDVIPALEGKAEQQDALMNAVKARIKKYKSK
jgi:SNF2 family DNA or RNA helicase